MKKHRYGKQESMGLNKTIHILPLPRFLNRLLHVYSEGFSLHKQ
ncbi:hypothetical protein L579_2720 [Pantoea sp. AS-PWVM4]|nr:hypothetical protein L579_2720 [Pantoea sp. AS-PWVM4]